MQGVNIKLVGDWRKKVHTSLSQALSVSIDIFNRDAGNACKHAVILMAQSLASKGNPITPISKKTRPVLSNDKGPYVERWRQGWSNSHKVYKWMFNRLYDSKGNIQQLANFRGSNMNDAGWERAQIIRNSGLARRSWMWGLAAWGGKEERNQISGTSEVTFKQTKTMVEAVKRNKLGYITRIMPPGWAEEAATRATNKIMAQAARKMEKQWISSLRGSNSAMASSVKSFFLAEAA